MDGRASSNGRQESAYKIKEELWEYIYTKMPHKKNRYTRLQNNLAILCIF